MLLTGSAQMRAADRRAIAEYHIPSIVLMERASRALAEAARPYLAPGGAALVLCGSGNNGGDGVGAAAELKNAGFAVRVLLAGDRAHATPDFLEMERRLAALGGSVEAYDPAAPLPPAAVIIDALFGIGLNKPVGGTARAAIEAVNASGVPVVAADIASGVEADTGRILGAAVRAAVTVTFSMAKPGHFVEPGCVCCGALRVADIGIPQEILDTCGTGIAALNDAGLTLPRRNRLSHKVSYGKILLLGGSVGYTGAPTLCARAAVRAGAGLVYLGVPAAIYEITAVKNDEAMPFPLPETGMTGEVIARLQGCTAAAAGPGLGRSAEAAALVAALLLSGAPRPLVLDADALNALAGRTELLDEYPGTAVLTPHEGEFLRLGGTLTGDRVADARRFAEKHGCVLLLKGHRCIAAFPDGDVFIATHGNPGMAKGGSGDVLTGILAAMLGQFPDDTRRAVCLGMHLHALAGDLCAAEKGEYAMTATDLIETLPAAAKSMMEE